jgi:type I restriction enzyme S subunit
MVRISDIQDGKINWNTVPFCDISEDEISTYLLGKNDILFARTGGTVGKSYIVKDLPEKSIYAGYLIRTQYSSLLSPEYLYYFMKSNLYWNFKKLILIIKFLLYLFIRKQINLLKLKNLEMDAKIF